MPDPIQAVDSDRFDSLEEFRRRLSPRADEVYRSIFRDVVIYRDFANHPKLGVLDRVFGIDVVLRLSSGCVLTIQEKVRDHWTWERYRQFTQEYRNAVGTSHEERGEWFKLAAELYFYAWANPEATSLVAWLLFDVVKYKLIVEREGGLDKVGTLERNDRWGRASFYGIPLPVLRPAIVETNIDPRFL